MRKQDLASRLLDMLDSDLSDDVIIGEMHRLSKIDLMAVILSVRARYI